MCIRDSLEGVTYEVSIRSVNSKQLDLSLRLPSILRDREIELRGILIPALFRGKVDVTIRTAEDVYKRQTLIRRKLTVRL